MSNMLTKEDVIFFADLGTLVATDLFVIDRVYKYLYRSNDREDTFSKLMDIMHENGLGYNALAELVQLKESHNPLMDYMKIPDERLAWSYYNGILCDETYGNDEMFLSMPLTKLGEAFKPLMKDTNFKDLYIYCNRITKPIHTYIYSIFNETTKIHLVQGDKEAFITEVPCDNYFFENINDMESVLKRGNRDTCTVYIPEYKYNIKTDKDRTVINWRKTASDLYDEDKISVVTMKLPVYNS